jgi:DNA-directed RNA polymerase specialized sigma24 family protein
MTPNFDQATIPASARPSTQRASQFKGMQVLESDEPLLAKLKPREQAVLRTTGSYEDRARELSVPVGTLRSRLHRARAKLLALRSEPHVPVPFFSA